MVSREILTLKGTLQSPQQKLDVLLWYQVKVPYIADNTFVHVIFRGRIGLKYQIRVYSTLALDFISFFPLLRAFKDAEIKSITPRQRGDTKTFWNSRWCILNAQNVGELFAYKPQSLAWQKLGEVMNSLHFNSGRWCYCFFVVLFYYMSPSKKRNQNVR